MKPNFRLHHHETASAAIVRVYKYVRTIKPDYVPQSHYASGIQYRKAMKPILKLVK